MIGRLNHIGVATPSIEASVALYRDLLGATKAHAPFDLPAQGVPFAEFYRQRLGSAAVREVFSLTQQRWHASANHPTWAGLRLLSVDGVVWRTPDTDDNRTHYGSASNQRCHRLAKDLAAGA